MKISYNWLKEYLPIDLAPEKVGEILTDIGLEIEGIEKKQSVEGGLKGLVVGEVLTAEQHPNADRLWLTTVQIGKETPSQIVCGAPNVAAGQKVVVATPGTKLYPINREPFTIKKGKIRGTVSMGMICAEDEIGIGTDHEGIIVLPNTAKAGQAVREVIPIEEDYIFEIGLTPNRSDALGHIGVANDLAAALKVHHNYEENIQLPCIDTFTIANNDLFIPVEVENTEACPRYSGVSIKGVTIQESPEWLQKRLLAVGVRPINNIVDITNYILHEFGQPLHAFDADQIEGKKVLVKNLPVGSTFVTLDEKERQLHPDDLMICNANSEGMCIAGVFGGIKSGVTENTKNIFLESAYFHPIRTRRTATRHNLRTDAATRFEKGVDPNNTVYVLKRAALLIQELAGGEIASEIVDIYPNKIERPQVSLSYKKLDKLIGISIPRPTVKQILTALDIRILAETAESLQLSVGTNRADVLREADIIEEVLRIYGFNNVPIPPHFNASLSYSQESDRKQNLNNITANYLVSNGFYETMRTSISDAKYYSDDSKLVYLLNNLNADLNAMRQSMLYGGLETILHNQNHQNTDLQIFEFGNTYAQYTKNDEKQYEEYSHLALFLTGNKKSENWQGKATTQDFFDLKKIVNNLLKRLGILSFQQVELKKVPFSYGLHYKLGKRSLVQLGAIQKSILKKFDLKQDVFYADINWDTVLQITRKKSTTFQEIAKYPSTRRDLALIVDKSVSFASIQRISEKTAKHLLKSINLFDIYENEEKIGVDKKSYAVSFVFQDPRKTLTDKEVDKLVKKLLNNFQRQLGASLR